MSNSSRKFECTPYNILFIFRLLYPKEATMDLHAEANLSAINIYTVIYI